MENIAITLGSYSGELIARAIFNPTGEEFVCIRETVDNFDPFCQYDSYSAKRLGTLLGEMVVQKLQEGGVSVGDVFNETNIISHQGSIGIRATFPLWCGYYLPPNLFSSPITAKEMPPSSLNLANFSEAFIAVFKKAK